MNPFLDLPLGANFIDHTNLSMYYHILTKALTSTSTRSSQVAKVEVEAYPTGLGKVEIEADVGGKFTRVQLDLNLLSEHL